MNKDLENGGQGVHKTTFWMFGVIAVVLVVLLVLTISNTLTGKSISNISNTNSVTAGNGTNGTNQTMHNTCINYKCVKVVGPGINQCYSNNDCTNQSQPGNQTTHNTCIDYQCVRVIGPGINQCWSNHDCANNETNVSVISEIESTMNGNSQIYEVFPDCYNTCIQYYAPEACLEACYRIMVA